MAFKSLTQVKRDQIKISKDIKQLGFGAALSFNPLMTEQLRLDITYQFEFPIVVKKGGRYYAVANYLPLIYPRFSESDSVYVIVVDLKPSLLKRLASNYIIHLMSFQTTYDVFYPLFKEAVLLNKQCGNIKSLRNINCSERTLADLLNVDRQTVRTFVNRNKQS
jgi:hypothetical protein